MTLNQMKARAQKFVADTKGFTDEEKSSQTWLTGFMDIFGYAIDPQAGFEQKVLLTGRTGYFDYLIRGKIAIEMKSAKKNLADAWKQLSEYIEGLNEDDRPQVAVVCDFQRMDVYGKDGAMKASIAVADLPNNLGLFRELSGIKTRQERECEANKRAVRLMDCVHDELKKSGYDGHQLEVYLTRLLFCVFAEDAGLFDKFQFQTFIARSAEDGSGLAVRIARLFQWLNTPDGRRGTINKRNDKMFARFDPDIKAFPYVNGGLFSEDIQIAEFDEFMRQVLLSACKYDWSQISPSIFGSMFQRVMDPELRRKDGAHFTNEENIEKVIGPLFLWGLKAELEAAGTNRRKLEALRNLIASMQILDPACGSGNFLLVSYMELRRIETEILRRLYDIAPDVYSPKFDVQWSSIIKLSQFHGVELNDFAAEIAKTSMWIAEHKANMEASAVAGTFIKKLPLVESADIVHGDSLEINWTQRFPGMTHIIGNPPFAGSKEQTAEQRAQTARITKSGVLDYVANWFVKAVEYRNAKVAFVSTESIYQGEQAPLLWPPIFQKGFEIDFAYKGFKWTNGDGKAAQVMVAIAGFSLGGWGQDKILYMPDGPAQVVPFISPTLTTHAVVVLKHNSTFLSAPTFAMGCKPIDGGNYIFETKEDLDNFLVLEPDAKKFIREYKGSEEMSSNTTRHILRLHEAEPNEIAAMPLVKKRMQAVSKFRLESTDDGTKKLASTPAKYHLNTLFSGSAVILACYFSSQYEYPPCYFVEDGDTCVYNNEVLISKGGHKWLFAILQSSANMAWVQLCSGALGKACRYSVKNVYNTFPWPDLDDAKKEKLEQFADAILACRKAHEGSNLRELYNKTTMPADLRKIHKELDRYVLGLFGIRANANQWQIEETLLNRYKKLLDDENAQIALNFEAAKAEKKKSRVRKKQ